MNRRQSIKNLSLGAMATLFAKKTLYGKPLLKPLTFGIISDIHKDLMPDADNRLQEFIVEASHLKVDFIIQLGDFCFGHSQNDQFLEIWNNFKGSKFHVLGNHDMDRNSKEEIMNYWQMPEPYYSFDQGGVHFIVLDANYIYQDGVFSDYANANFYIDNSLRTFINPRQIEWFLDDLDKTNLPTIVCSHQSLIHPQWGVKKNSQILLALEKNADKVVCCLNGHNHIDKHLHINGIDFIDINSASYQWVGKALMSTERFSDELYNTYPNLPHIAGYTKPLFCFAEINREGTFSLKGRSAEWMKPSPFDLSKGVEKEEFSNRPCITDREINF